MSLNPIQSIGYTTPICKILNKNQCEAIYSFDNFFKYNSTRVHQHFMTNHIPLDVTQCEHVANKIRKVKIKHTKAIFLKKNLGQPKRSMQEALLYTIQSER